LSQKKYLSAEQRINALMEIHPKGYDLSLDRISGLLEKLGNPQYQIPPVVHFAGTNGKGSTIAFTRSILEAAGLRVHVHTSPHLVNWHERYRIGAVDGGTLVDDTTLSNAIERVAQANDGQPITVFEVLSAVTFILFADHPADVCLIEVGLGGRFDATNVMDQVAVSVITPVSMDHEAFLGDTLAKIAFEKAGIIKQSSTVVVGPQQETALEVIERQAGKNLASLQRSGQEFSYALENGRISYQAESHLFDLDLPKLPGSHQVDNAATAITAALSLCEKIGHELTNETMNIGIQTAYWPGRMQKLETGKLVDIAPRGSRIWLDGGHNPDAGRVISDYFKVANRSYAYPLVMICGMLQTKDAANYLRQFKGLIDRMITVPIVSSDAGIPADELVKTALDCELRAESANSLNDAILKLDPDNPVTLLIAGSLYLVGDALHKNGTPPV